jgi:hypothetical protein
MAVSPRYRTNCLDWQFCVFEFTVSIGMITIARGWMEFSSHCYSTSYLERSKILMIISF